MQTRISASSSKSVLNRLVWSLASFIRLYQLAWVLPYIILLVLGIFIGWCIFILPLMYSDICKTETKMLMTDIEVDNMYTIIKSMDYWMRQYSIEYFAISGTLLGAIRNRPSGPMRWDDDVDVAIIFSEENKLKEMHMNDKFRNQIEMIYYSFGYQYRMRNQPKEVRKEYTYDVIIFEPKPTINDNRLRVRGHLMQSLNILNTREVVPSIDCRFWDFLIKCPRTLSLLEQEYGKGAVRYSKRWNHEEKENINIDIWNHYNTAYAVPALSRKLSERLMISNKTVRATNDFDMAEYQQ